MDRESASKGATVKTQIRLPSDLHERVVKAAAASGRSLNAEMLHRLDQSFRRSVDDAQLMAYANRINETLELQQHELELTRFLAAGASQMLVGYTDPQLLAMGLPDDDHLKEIREAAAKVAEIYANKLGNRGGIAATLQLGEDIKRQLGSDESV